MKKIFTLLSLIFLINPLLASAHTGVEHGEGFWRTFLHLITEPDHIFIVGSIVILWYGVMQQRQPKAKSSIVPRETTIKG